MASQTTALANKKLTPKQVRWAQLVATGCYSDTAAYVKAYGAKQSTAEKSAFRLRADPGVMQEVARWKVAIAERLADKLTAKSRKGVLVDVMLNGEKDSDRIRAVQVLEMIDEKERAMGGGEGTEFETLLMLVARRPRVLPKDDPDDIIDI